METGEMHELARQAIQARLDAGLPAYKSPLEKLADKPASLRRAVTAKCYDCQGGGADPAWQWRVGNCEIPGCPLWGLRPYQSKCGTATPVALRE